MADPVDSATNEELKLDAANLYREETITDLKTGSLLRLVPVRPDGGDDSSRPPMFVARTQIMTRMGAMPIEAPLAATSLAEAIAALISSVMWGMTWTVLPRYSPARSRAMTAL